ncbi:MAG: hypothetical protein ACK5V3_05550 [Bdellovibrionales bacterium]
MRFTNSSQLILGSVSMILTILLMLSSSLSIASDHYSMTVTKKAWVNSNSSPTDQASLNCKNQSLTKSVATHIKSYSKHGQKPLKIMNISNDMELFAIHNTDDEHLNNVNLWLKIKRKNKNYFFEISEIMMHAYELPRVQWNKGALVIQATTYTVDPNQENDIQKIPTVLGQLYEVIRFDKLTDTALQLHILSCQ